MKLNGIDLKSFDDLTATSDTAGESITTVTTWTRAFISAFDVVTDRSSGTFVGSVLALVNVL